MAVRLVFRTVTKERDRLLLRQVLKQSQRKLLPVVLDALVARIHSAGFQHLSGIALTELGPRYPATQEGTTQLFAWAQIRHPNVKPLRRQTASAAARCQNPEPVGRFDRAMN